MFKSLNFKKRLHASTIKMFSHGNFPMKNTLDYKGDPGLFGPNSQTWRIISHVSGFMGGIRALYLQAAHPEVVAGVHQHSNYQEDPFGRLSRTGDYVAVTCFGAMTEVQKMVTHVKAMHERVHGVSKRGLPYNGSAPPLLSWVHNSLVDSFLTAYKLYGDTPLLDEDADKFVTEQTKVGKLMGANELPTTAKALQDWINNHPDLAQTEETLATTPFLNRPPLTRTMLIGYNVLRDSAIGSIAPRIQKILGLKQPNLSKLKGRFFTAALHASMGYSPSLELAYRRLDMPIPRNRWFVSP